MMMRLSGTGNRNNFTAGSVLKGGFTFFEVLVAVTILGFGFVYIFRVFFGSLYAMEHVSHRIDAGLILNEKIWKAKTLINQKDMTGGYAENTTEGLNPEYFIALRASRAAGSERFFTLAADASWRERGKQGETGRVIYVRKAS